MMSISLNLYYFQKSKAMELKLVSFELAKLLKEVGFDVKVLNFYDQNKEVSKSTYKDLCNWNDEVLRDSAYSAPQLELAKQWFREKHEIIIRPIDEAHPKIWVFDIISKKGSFHYALTSYESYEEALEQGLIEAIKLIH